MRSGVDTVSYAYRPEGHSAFDALLMRPHNVGGGGSLVLAERGPDGGRVMAWPGYQLIAYESRLGAVLAGAQSTHALAPVAALAAGGEAAREAVGEIIRADPGPASEVRRFDLASEIFFEQSAEGLAFLSSLRGICPPRARTTHEVDAAGAVMTAYIRTAKRGVVLSRVYDKGREAGTHPPGIRIRIESQNRPPRARRMRPEVLAAQDLSTTFGRTMSHYLKADTLVAAGSDAAVMELIAKAHRGHLSVAKAERLAGSTLFLKAAGRAAYHDPDKSEKENNRKSARRLKALRDEGISLEHELPPTATVPTSQLLRDAIDAFTA
jgi:hypothetical protein